jgi:hypothetical protein
MMMDVQKAFIFILAILPICSGWQFVNATWLSQDVPSLSIKPISKSCSLYSDACNTLFQAAADSDSSATSHDNTIIVTCLDHHLLEMYSNFVCGLTELNLTHRLVVYALDDIAYQSLHEMGAPVIRFRDEDNHREREKQSTNNDESIHGTTQFARLTYKKLHIVNQVLRAGYHVLYSDVDVSWLRNPFIHLSIPNHLIFLFANDWTMVHHQTSTNKDLQYICTGFFYARSHAMAVNVLETAIDYGTHGKNKKTFFLIIFSLLIL